MRSAYKDFFKRVRPELFTLLYSCGDASCQQYARGIFESPGHCSSTLSNLLFDHARRIHGEEVAELVRRGSIASNVIATGEHASILDDPLQLQSALMLAGGAPPSVPVVLSLPFGNVPFDNASTGSAYVTWNGQRYRLISNNPKQRRRLIFGRSGLSSGDLQKSLGARYADLRHLFPDTIFGPDPPPLTSQFAAANQLIWKSLFPSCDQVCPYVQIPAEELVIDLLRDSFENQGLLFDLVFDSCARAHYVDHFSGIRCCHTNPGDGPTAGTHLFWARSATTGRQFRFFLRPGTGYLDPWNIDRGRLAAPESHHGVGPVNLDGLGPEGVLRALDERTLVPSVFLAMVSLVSHGVLPCGGYHQVTYLEEIRVRMLGLLDALRRRSGARRHDACKWRHLQTNRFCLGPLFLWHCQSGSTYPYRLWDLWQLPVEQRQQKVIRCLKQTSLLDATILGATVFGASLGSAPRDQLPDPCETVRRLARD